MDEILMKSLNTGLSCLLGHGANESQVHNLLIIYILHGG